MPPSPAEFQFLINNVTIAIAINDDHQIQVPEKVGISDVGLFAKNSANTPWVYHLTVSKPLGLRPIPLQPPRHLRSFPSNPR
jgi:hypothetical protein